jgi:hypothetical protein
MRKVTVQISDQDYADMLQFFAQAHVDGEQIGKPLIAVAKLVPGEQVSEDLWTAITEERERRAAFPPKECVEEGKNDA